VQDDNPRDGLQGAAIAFLTILGAAAAAAAAAAWPLARLLLRCPSVKVIRIKPPPFPKPLHHPLNPQDRQAFAGGTMMYRAVIPWTTLALTPLHLRVACPRGSLLQALKQTLFFATLRWQVRANILLQKRRFDHLQALL
jgi:hypothetical protein